MKNSADLNIATQGYQLCIDTKRVYGENGYFHVETLLINYNKVITSDDVDIAIANDNYDVSTKDNLVCLELRNSDNETSELKWSKPHLRKFVNVYILMKFNLKLVTTQNYGLQFRLLEPLS